MLFDYHTMVTLFGYPNMFESWTPIDTICSSKNLLTLRKQKLSICRAQAQQRGAVLRN